MVSRVVLGALLLALAAPAPMLAQSADCTVDVEVRPGPVLDIAERCQSSRPLKFVAEDQRTMRHVSDLKASDYEARYRFDLKAFAREVDSTSIAVARGDGVLAILGSWLLEPQGFDQPPTIDIRAHTADGLVFTSGLPKAGDAYRLSGTGLRFAGYTAIGARWRGPAQSRTDGRDSPATSWPRPRQCA